MPPMSIIAHNSRRHKRYTAATYFNPRIFPFSRFFIIFRSFKKFLDFLAILY